MGPIIDQLGRCGGRSGCAARCTFGEQESLADPGSAGVDIVVESIEALNKHL